jgi:hypothetical protein
LPSKVLDVTAAPLPLDVATELVGEWFEPGKEDQRASGRLLFDPDHGLNLETVSDLPLFPRDTIPIMLGVTVDGRLVTLRDVMLQTSTYNSLGGTLAKAHVRMAFVGMHASNLSELRLWNVQARLSHLNDWCFTSGIDFGHAFFPTAGQIAFRPPSSIVLARNRGALISVSFEFQGSRRPETGERLDPYAFNLEQRAWLSITPRRGRWPYDQYDELLTRIRWFFGFAAGAQDELLELRGEATQSWRAPEGRVRRARETVWILFTPPSLFHSERRRASDMLVCRPDLRAEEQARPLTRWLRLCDQLEMEPVLGPYFAALPTQKMYSDLRFLVFAQAAEAYDARRRPGTRTKQISFKTRVETLVASMPGDLRALVPATFAEEVKNTRNFGTHRDAKNRKRAATGARLWALSELLKFVFDLAMLRELGFTQTQIVELVNRNDRVRGLIRMATDYLAQTKPGR